MNAPDLSPDQRGQQQHETQNQSVKVINYICKVARFISMRCTGFGLFSLV